VKFIIYKGTGGLAHMCRGISSAISIAASSNRHLIIDCKTHEAFKRDFYDYFKIEDDTLSHGSDFEVIPPSTEYNGIPVKDLACINAGGKIDSDGNLIYTVGHGDWDDSWVIDNYETVLEQACSEQPVVIYAGCGVRWDENIRVRDSVVERLADYKRNSLLEDKEYIAVHFRNTDLQNDFALFTKLILDASAEHNISTVYLATDDAHAYSKFKKALAGIDLVQFSTPEDFGGRNIHYLTADKDRLIIHCLLDMYMLLTSKIFISSGNSSLSKWITEMADSGVNIFGISGVFANAT